MKDICEKFIPFGTGGFLRGFADWMIQKRFLPICPVRGIGNPDPKRKNDCREIALCKSGVTL